MKDEKLGDGTDFRKEDMSNAQQPLAKKKMANA